MAKTHITSNVPPDRVEFVIAVAKASGGVLVDKTLEDDGEFTLVFEFPDASTPAFVVTDVSPSAMEFGISATPASPAAGGAVAQDAAAALGSSMPWLNIARAVLDVTEMAGSADEARIVAFHATTRGGPAPDSVPWCSSFVNWCIERTGLVGTDSKLARSWLGWGVGAGGAIPGCVVVLERGAPPKGHVGFLIGVEPGRVSLLGGNQGNRVSVATFPDDRILGMRLPSPAALAAAGLGGDALSAAAQRRRRIDTLARTIWGEAHGESERGKKAVAAVVVNRARRGPVSRFGEGIDGVCRQPRQFSCWNDDDPNLPKLLAVTAADETFQRCLRIAERAVDGKLDDPTSGSDHYHTDQVTPDWSAGHTPVARIGSHLFFNDIA